MTPSLVHRIIGLAMDVRQMLGYLSAYRGVVVGLLLNFGSPRLTWRRVRLARGEQ